MAQIKWTNQALLDLKDIFDYIARDSKKYAYYQTRSIKEKTKQLKKNSSIGRIVPELEREDVRELLDGNYRIIYRIKSSSRIDIISIFHSARILKIDDRI